jgi:hypothetical protein
VLAVEPIEIHGAFEREMLQIAKGYRNMTISMFAYNFNEALMRAKWHHLLPKNHGYQILLFEDEHIEVWHHEYHKRDRVVLKVNRKPIT